MRKITSGMALVLALAPPAGIASADDTLSGEEIRNTVADHTVSGTMESSGAYAEYYAADGTIRGEGYTGAWTIEGDIMCFAYGSESAGCWHVGREGEKLLWIQDGEVLGDGMAEAGNTNEF